MMELHSSPCEKNRTTHEERMLQIDKLDKWQTHVKEKLRIHNAEPKRRHDEHKDGTNQLKARDQVLLDKTDRQIATSKLNANRITPFTVLNVFPYDTVEVTYSELGTFKRPYFETKMARQLVVLALVLIALVGVVSTDASSTGGSLQVHQLELLQMAVF
ncbi:hypothetical protein GOBAR_DD10750 [Gossypium barbadense]|nr:hypothetical protein GOBAR_DD10750 [Gossypium barbadense]